MNEFEKWWAELADNTGMEKDCAEMAWGYQQKIIDGKDKFIQEVTKDVVDLANKVTLDERYIEWQEMEVGEKKNGPRQVLWWSKIHKEFDTTCDFYISENEFYENVGNNCLFIKFLDPYIEEKK